MNNLQAMVSIEQTLSDSGMVLAQSQITALNPINSIEWNYKNYYQIYKNTKDSSFTLIDSLDLATLANKCPFTEGGVVFQARALYNYIYNGYNRFSDNCIDENENYYRQAKSLSSDEKNINVLLKTKLYPNPNDGTFVIVMSNNETIQEKQKAEISVFDLTGKQVFSGEEQIQVGQELKLKLQLLNGIYLLKVKLADASVDIHRLIIER
jgi:hypothetical protein